MITGDEEHFTFDVEELEEDGEQFTSVFSTLTIQAQENKHKQLSATCRFSIFSSFLKTLFALCIPLLNFLCCRVKSYGDDLTIDLSSSSSITVECEKMLSKI